MRRVRTDTLRAEGRDLGGWGGKGRRVGDREGSGRGSLGRGLIGEGVQGRPEVADLILDIVDIATKGRFGIATKGRFGIAMPT